MHHIFVKFIDFIKEIFWKIKADRDASNFYDAFISSIKL